MTEVTFDQAVQDESLRQQYLDQRFAAIPPAFATNLLYMGQDGRPFQEWAGDVYAAARISEEKYFSLRNDPMCYLSTLFVPCLREEWGECRSLPVFVNPIAFDRLTAAGLDNLVVHEGIHVADYALGVPLTDGSRITAKDMDVRDEVLIPYVEMRAYDGQLRDHLRSGEITVKDHASKWESRFNLIAWFNAYDAIACQQVGVTETEACVLASAMDLSNRFAELVNAPYIKEGVA